MASPLLAVTLDIILNSYPNPMSQTIHMLMIGHGTGYMDTIQSLASQLPDVKIKTRLLKDIDLDFLANSDFKADVLIYFLGAKAQVELEALAAQNHLSKLAKLAVLIVYDQGTASTQLMRIAMQAGASDFIMGPKLVDDTLAALRIILEMGYYEHLAAKRELSAVFSAQGGGGASTIACGLAHALTTRHKIKTLLLDLDLQFGTQSLRLAIESPKAIMDAIASIETLDEIALMGYVAKHSSGLHILHGSTNELILPGEIDVPRLKRLIHLVYNCYEQVVIDLPRLIDPVFNMVLEQADHVIIVIQQDISSLKSAQRMIKIMTQDLGVPLEHIMPVLNRYDANNSIKLTEVELVLGLQTITVIPSDFKNLCQALNLGIPIAEQAPNSPATLAILSLADMLIGKKKPDKPGFFRQLLHALLFGVIR